MKKYDRIKKEWVSEEELERRTQARQKTCKGGKEHDYVQVLPWGYEANEKYQGNPELVYKTETEIADFTKAKYAELELHGIIRKSRPWSYPKDHRNFMCSVCKKQKTTF